MLLAEDNPINREIMLSQLTALGYTVEEAASGKEALRKYQAGPYDLVLTDIEMPEMDGYGLAAEIRRLEQDAGRRTADPGHHRQRFRPGRRRRPRRRVRWLHAQASRPEGAGEEAGGYFLQSPSA